MAVAVEILGSQGFEGSPKYAAWNGRMRRHDGRGAVGSFWDSAKNQVGMKDSFA